MGISSTAMSSRWCRSRSSYSAQAIALHTETSPPGRSGRRLPRPARLGDAGLEERILDRDLVPLERKDVTPVDLELFAVGGRPREEPFRHAAVAGDEVPRGSEVGVRESLEDPGEGLADLLTSREALAAGLRPRRRLEDAVVRHESHEVVDVVPVPAIAKRFQILDRHHGLASSWKMCPSMRATITPRERRVKRLFRVRVVWGADGAATTCMGAGHQRGRERSARGGAVVVLNYLPQLLDRGHEAVSLGPAGDKARQNSTNRDRVGDEAAALGRVHLPVAGVLPEEIVGVVGVEMPFDTALNRVWILDHVEGEGGRTDTSTTTSPALGCRGCYCYMAFHRGLTRSFVFLYTRYACSSQELRMLKIVERTKVQGGVLCGSCESCCCWSRFR